ncbi:hypothetical protein [Saccharibacillus deserti]|uniref:hypothetical protein n=1 Tax=Saccharibacillus deserti TaxID=1634444 RepID=UPI00155476E1|nr:hypothetical protein [Saccharibacillus deserti]
MDFLQRIKDGAGRASERAQSAVEIGRLNSHISDIQREIEVHYLRIGQVLYENYSNRDTAPAEEEISELCTACDLLSEEIKEMRVRIAELRGEQLCACGARVDADAAECPHCGRRLQPASVEAGAAVPAPRVRLEKPTPVETKVEAEQVHDLVDDPDFGLEEDEPVEQPAAYAFYEPEEPIEEQRTAKDASDRHPPAAERELRTSPLVGKNSMYEEDEQFETKRFDLGKAEEYTREDLEEDEDLRSGASSAEEVRTYGPAARAGESAEQREERQRRELREIRAEERRRMKEGREPSLSALPAGSAEPEEPEAGPAYDAEYERRQRERIEREKERQDELDRLIASWNGGAEYASDEAGAEPIIVRRPVGEVVRCQVCGSGLPKGSKWCPHCASEQI